MLQKLNQFHKTTAGYAVFGLIELGLAALLATLAIDSGSLWQWALTVVFALGVVNNIIRLLQKVMDRGNKQTI